MKRPIVPLYVLILVIAIPQLSETIYVPALPIMSKYFNVLANLIEMTLTTYLIGFSIGILIWGSLSDKYGRKPIFILGFIIYGLACLFCYNASSIDQLLIFRFIQAVGASVGSVLGQAVARDVITPENRGRTFSVISIAMAFAPAIGPIIGGFAVEYFTWNIVFAILIAVALTAIYVILTKLPETKEIKNPEEKANILLNYYKCFKQMCNDKKLLGFGFIVGSVNGLMFGYFAESPFYFIKILGLSNSSFGLLSFCICIPLLIGGFVSKAFHKKQYSHIAIIHKGIMLILFSSTLFFFCVNSKIISVFQAEQSVVLSYFFIFMSIMGVSIIIPNSLSHALEEYGKYAGTAASLFGFYYCCIIAAMTLLMSILHNGQLLQLPLFFFIQGLSLFIVFNLTLRQRKEAEVSNVTNI